MIWTTKDFERFASDSRLWEEFSANVFPDLSGCWGWRGHRTMDGCPILRSGVSKSVSARAWAMQEFLGRRGTKNFSDCGNRHCVNPTHVKGV